ncbi:MAG: putative membrane protein YeiH [Candidatus Azotimanducaceae bacterium]|jgi:uncharacterized membrane protein YeiH
MSLLLIADYSGVFLFAMTGAMLAARKEMDIFGFVVLALMPAVGGGTLRDLILGEPVFWLSDTTYLFVTIAAALLTFFAVRLLERLNGIIVWLDALGLSVFCAIGASKAMSVTGDPVIGVMMGVITAVAGGILRDVIANEAPLVLHKEVYATAAFAGSLTYVVLLDSVPAFALVASILIAFIVRAMGIAFGLSLPAAKSDQSGNNQGS